MKKIAVAFAVGALLAGPLVLRASAEAPKAAETQKAAEAPKVYNVGDSMPDFSLPDLDGNTKSFRKDIAGKGKLGVIAFMTTSCSACGSELRTLNKFKDKYQDDLQITAISVDLKGKETVKPYRDEYRFKVDYLLDPDFTVAQMFQVSFTPALVFYDKGGKILMISKGYKPGERALIETKTAEFLK